MIASAAEIENVRDIAAIARVEMTGLRTTRPVKKKSMALRPYMHIMTKHMAGSRRSTPG
jgi:hypothetical protein